MTEASTVNIVDSAGEKTGSIGLPAEVFNAPLNIPLMHQVTIGQLAMTHQGIHITKTRDGVRDGGRKPCHQKGIGHVRQGSIRAPQFAGGGTTHGPQPRDYSQRTPEKVKAAALRSALSDRAHNGRVHVITEFVTITVPLTKSALVTLHSLIDRKALMIVDRQDDPPRFSLRNAPEAYALWVDQLNTYGVLKSDGVVFTTSGLNAFLGKGKEEPK